MGAFRPLEPKSVRWKPLQGSGLEHLTLRREDEAILAHGVAIGEFEGTPFGVRYAVVCDPDWTFRKLDLETTDGTTLRLYSNGHGAWTDSTGRTLPGFENCIDIDLGGTAFTNTLPIRRLGIDVDHGPVELSMVYIPFNTFSPFVDGQRYTCLESAHRYRYEAVDGAFTGELTVDEDGLIVDFPPLFARA